MISKRIKAILLMLTAVVALITSSCGERATGELPVPTEETSSVISVLPTIGEPEWAPVDSELELRDSDGILANRSDFERFAIIGSGDEAYLSFKLTEEAENALSLSAARGWYLTLDGNSIGGVEVDEENSVTLKTALTYNELCELATRIRGL